MRALIQTIKNIYKIEDLRYRIGYTLFILLIYRLGTYVVLPGIDPSQLAALQKQTADGVLGLIKYVFRWCIFKCIYFCIRYYALHFCIYCNSVIRDSNSLFPEDYSVKEKVAEEK